MKNTKNFNQDILTSNPEMLSTQPRHFSWQSFPNFFDTAIILTSKNYDECRNQN